MLGITDDGYQTCTCSWNFNLASMLQVDSCMCAIARFLGHQTKEDVCSICMK